MHVVIFEVCFPAACRCATAPFNASYVNITPATAIAITSSEKLQLI
jgi:hypothetical protein